MWFQSTHSLRSATWNRQPACPLRAVSIHALLAECDTWRASEVVSANSFNPRTPCGVRRGGQSCAVLAVQFQSTHSLRSAPALDDLDMISMWVSIHALLAECDYRSRTQQTVSSGGFQSTHSLRSATQPTLYITTQQSKSYFAPTSLKRPSLHGYTF